MLRCLPRRRGGRAGVRHDGHGGRRTRRGRNRSRPLAPSPREPNGGLIALPHVVTAGHRELIARLAIEHRLPSVGAFGFMATSGGLISYGIDVVDLFRRSASYVDRILKGEKTGRPSGAGADQVRACDQSQDPPRRSVSTCRRQCSPAPTR